MNKFTVFLAFSFLMFMPTDHSAQVRLGCMVGSCNWVNEPDPTPSQPAPPFEKTITFDVCTSDDGILDLLEEGMFELLKEHFHGCSDAGLVYVGGGIEILPSNMMGETKLVFLHANVNKFGLNLGHVRIPSGCGGQVTLSFFADCNGANQVELLIHLQMMGLEIPTAPADEVLTRCGETDNTIQSKLQTWSEQFKYNAINTFDASTTTGYCARDGMWEIYVQNTDGTNQYYTHQDDTGDGTISPLETGGKRLQDSLQNMLDSLLSARLESGVTFKVIIEHRTPTSSCRLKDSATFTLPKALVRCPPDITTYLPDNSHLVSVSWEVTDNCQGGPFSNPNSGSFFSLGTTTVNVNSLLPVDIGGWACTFTVEVLDSTPPQIIACPPEINVVCHPPPHDYIMAGGEVSDNSGTFFTQSWDYRLEDTVFRTYQFQDQSGNSTECVQKIILTSTEPCILYVDATKNGLKGDSWFNAFSSLQTAINIAGDGDQIWVAAGTYLPTQKINGITNRHKTFHINNDIQIFGGFSGTETTLNQRDWQAYPTILSGNTGNLNSNTDNAYHVLYFDGVSGLMRLDGLIIEDGYGTTDGGSVDGQGAGMYISGGSPTLAQCVLRNNTSANGGAIFAISNSNFSIINSVLYDNFAVLAENAKGGHIYTHTSSDADILNCTFFYGVAEDKGQMIYSYNSEPTIYNSILWDGTDGNNNEIESDLQTPIQTNNLLNDPKFIDQNGFDFRLRVGSPAKNTGDVSLLSILFPPHDFAGNARVQIGQVDIGAFEYACPSSLSLNASDLPLNGPYEAQSVVNLESGMTIKATNQVTLDAPSVELPATFETQLSGELIVSQNGCTNRN